MYDVYDNRELSWLKFNERVLDEARDNLTPPLEKLRFISIAMNNLDEFYMVRVGSLSDHILLKRDFVENKTGMSDKEQLDNILQKTASFYQKAEEVYKGVVAELYKNDIRLLKFSNLYDSQVSYIKDLYIREIEPLLSPQIVDNKHPFPHLENRAVYIALHLKRKDKFYLGFVLKSSAVSNIIRLPAYNGVHFVLTDDAILHCADRLFPSYEIIDKCLIKITRNADLEVLEGLYDEDIDYRAMMKSLVKKRIRLTPVRIEVSKNISKDVKKMILRQLDENIILINKIPLSFSFFDELSKSLTKEELEKVSYQPLIPQLPEWYNENESLIEKVFREDIFLSYPYNSMKPFFKLLEEAVLDKDVISIKVTLYRLSGNSKIANLLLKACEVGKDVTVIMELRARFDETNNINYSEILETAGARVIYGLHLYKVHSKVLLITKKLQKDIKYITHIGTGNYNEITAKLYTDLNIITTDKDIGNDAIEFFNNITTSNINGKYKKLLASPFGISQAFCDLIDKEIAFQKEFGDGNIIMKFNSLTSKTLIDKLVEASQAGVKIQLIIRGICCLIPGIEGKTENITVVSIVGRFLEHSRIYYFNHHKEKKIYIASADLMTRNLERRVEIATPVLSEKIKKEITNYLLVLLSDDVKTRILNNDGIYRRKENLQNLNSQMYFFEKAYENAEKRKSTIKTEQVGFFRRLFDKFKK